MAVATQKRSGGWEKDRDARRRRSAELSTLGRRIAPISKVAKPRRRNGTRLNFEKWCRTYFAPSFSLPFSQDHLTVISRIETAVTTGGLFALAMPRGSGKTTLCECACLWAMLHAHRSFVVLIGSDEGKAASMLESIKVELETNELLLEDFPETCEPIHALERIAHRCRGQMSSEGEPTYISWQAGELVLPTIKGSKASGAIAMSVGLTASIRGLKHKRADGTAIRPDLVVVDDPQTDESARSASQCAYRERVLSGAVLGLAGPGKKISGIMPCTVIAPGDVADNLLDPQKHPEWHGLRTRLLDSPPTNTALWQRYADILADSLRSGNAGREATEFYRDNREAMDEGASASWPERHNPDEISAVQHAMNLQIRDPHAFAAEYQNDPQPLDKSDLVQMSADAISQRTNRHTRGLLSARVTSTTAFVDVQGDLLYWMVCGWGPGFSGAVIDYGTYPEQSRPYFRLSEANPTLAQITGVSSLEGSLWSGLLRLMDQLLGREYQQDGGGVMRISRLLIDSGWGTTADLIYRFARQCVHAATILPSKGTAVGARHNPMHEWSRQPGEQHGSGWIVRPAKQGRPRLALFDANHWKSFIAGRLMQPVGETGSLTLFGENPSEHRMLCDHLTSEFRVRTEGRGRQVEEWSIRPERPDNHWWDCLVGCAVAASIEGVKLSGAGEDARPAPARSQSWKEIQRAKMEARRRERG